MGGWGRHGPRSGEWRWWWADSTLQEERNRTDVRASELVVAAGAATRGQVEAREVRAVAVRPIGGRRTGIGTATAEAEQSNRLSKFVSALP